MATEEEITQLRLKIEAYETTLAQRELERNEYRNRIVQLELQLKAYEEKNANRNSVEAPTTFASTSYNDRLQFNPVPALSPSESRQSASVKFVVYEHEASLTKKRRGNVSINERPVKARQAPRWIAAGERLLENIGQSKIDTEVTRLEETESSHLEGSPYERAKTMAERASNTLDIATHAATIARIELFFFLSALRVLDQRKTLSPSEINKVMDLLEGNTQSFAHRRKILSGVKWFHEILISKLFEDWDIGHAIAVVAKSSPTPPSQYEHVKHVENEERIIKALEDAKKHSESFKCVGWLFFAYVRLWDPCIGPDEILQSLYPKRFSNKWKTTEEEFRKLTQCSPDALFPLLYPNVSSPDWLAPFQQRLVSFASSKQLFCASPYPRPPNSIAAPLAKRMRIRPQGLELYPTTSHADGADSDIRHTMDDEERITIDTEITANPQVLLSPFTTATANVLPTADGQEVGSNTGTVFKPIQNVNQSHPAPLTDSALMCVLARWLGNSLPAALILRTSLAQSRWNDKGEQVTLAPSEAGVNQHLLAIILTESRRKDALSSFDEEEQCWVISGNTHSSIIQDSRETGLFLDALNWVCFAFPRIESEEPQYASLARLLYPLLDNALRGLYGIQLPRSVNNEIAEVLLAATKVAGMRADVLPSIARYLDEESPTSLRAEVVLEQSILYRLRGDYDKSERTIHDFCCQCGCPTDECLSNFFKSQALTMEGKTRAVHGLLHRSHLENLVQREEYVLASRQIGDWPEPSSPMDWATYPIRALTSCKIYRSQGNFEIVRETLEICLRTLRDHEAVYPRIFCQLLDVYSDLERWDLSAQLLVSAEGKHTGGALRRILVSSLDVDLQRRHYPEARKTIKHICETFEKSQNLNISDELLHIRSLIAAARINYLCAEFGEALQRWGIVLEHVQRYVSFRGEGFTYAVIHLSISLVYLELNARSDAAESFEHGARILRETKRDYWVPTLQTWFRYVASTIFMKAQWSF